MKLRTKQENLINLNWQKGNNLYVIKSTPGKKLFLSTQFIIPVEIHERNTENNSNFLFTFLQIF